VGTTVRLNPLQSAVTSLSAILIVLFGNAVRANEPVTTLDAEPARIETVTEQPISLIELAVAETTTESSTSSKDDGFSKLLTKDDLTGWTVVGGQEDAWSVTDGVLSCVRPGGGWVALNEEVADFTLRFDYKLSPGANSGVGLRFPMEGNPAFTGIEVQLLDDNAEKYAGLRPDQFTGSLYYFAAPQERPTTPVGHWHTCEIDCQGKTVKVSINGKLNNEASLKSEDNTPPHPVTTCAASGHLGFQSSTARVEFRKILLKNHVREVTGGVQIVELLEGDGELVEAGATVTVDYVGRLAEGKQFDSSYDRGRPVTVPLSKVIPGWREGLPGMRVGGKRKLTIPAAMAYGDKGVGDAIPPNATLVFEVELRAVEH